MELVGKKLLYLGGIQRARYVVERAQSMGIYVIVADYLETNPAKEVADEAIKINALDVDALEQYCRMNNIDGVFSGYVDVILPCWKELCNRLNLPCYIMDSMLKSATDKAYFKAQSIKYNVLVPRTYHINNLNVVETAQQLPYPVFIKPLDASGSRGADVCYNKDEFKQKYEYALSYSKKKSVTVEEFLHGTEFILDYMIVNGEPHLASMADRYTTDDRSKAINSPNLMILPSKHLHQYLNEVNPLVCNMFRKEKYSAGVVFLQGYAGEKIAFYETGCRLGGTWPYIDEYYHGMNPMDMLFRYALTGKMLEDVSEANNIDADYKGYAAIIYFLANKKEATISKVIGMEKVKDLSYVVHVMEHYAEGDHYELGNFTDIRFSAVHLVAEEFELLKQRIKYIYSIVDYQNEDGTSLLANVYDVEELEGYA